MSKQIVNDSLVVKMNRHNRSFLIYRGENMLYISTLKRIKNIFKLRAKKTHQFIRKASVEYINGIN